MPTFLASNRVTLGRCSARGLYDRQRDTALHAVGASVPRRCAARNDTDQLSEGCDTGSALVDTAWAGSPFEARSAGLVYLMTRHLAFDLVRLPQDNGQVDVEPDRRGFYSRIVDRFEIGFVARDDSRISNCSAHGRRDDDGNRGTDAINQSADVANDDACPAAIPLAWPGHANPQQ